MSPESVNGVTYLTPGELCARWNIDHRTLQKLPLRWFYVSSTIRRIRLQDVEAYEHQQRIGPQSDGVGK